VNSTIQKFAIDPVHTSVELMLAKVRGRLASVSGGFAVVEGSSFPEEVEVSIAVASIETREEQRDGHLKSPDFLDVANFPQILFKSRDVEGSGEKFQLRGELTIHGTTREVVLDGTFEGRGPDPWGNERVGYSAQTTISRKDFGLTWNQALETCGVLVGDEVRIELNVEGIAQK